MNKVSKLVMTMVALLSLIIVPQVAFANRSSDNDASSAQGEPNCLEDDIRPGRTLIIPAGCRVHGDVKVGSVHGRQFKLVPDTDPETGQVVELNQPARVFFEFGGGVTAQPTSSIVGDMARTGCDRGCAHGTNVMVWPQTARANDSTS